MPAIPEECKWCQKGQCWDHGQEAKPKGKGKGKGGGKQWSNGGGLDMGVIQTILKLATGAGQSQWAPRSQWSGKGGGGGSWPKPCEKDTSGGILGEFVGTIKSKGNKYGFIVSDDTTAMGYSDVFCMWDEIKGYKAGHKVKFTAFLDGQGKIQAKDLKSGLK
eukprot:TRINITY_DN59243_c0_g1_i1.p1 TRINITY_DN59243_c0_g1~~TRINITY_DN59243_c0_g1_i1.p1  ORF type:complete len:162 (-),score=41.27 TRINITY_DN59243_c0_g1_i1:79-564(-)